MRHTGAPKAQRISQQLRHQLRLNGGEVWTMTRTASTAQCTAPLADVGEGLGAARFQARIWWGSPWRFDVLV